MGGELRRFGARRFGLTAAGVCAALAAWVATISIGPTVAAAAPVDAPDVTGSSLADASNALQGWDSTVTVQILPWDSGAGAFTGETPLTPSQGADPTLFTVAGEQTQLSDSGPVVDLGLTVKVPDLTNDTVDDAGQHAQQSGFNLGFGGEVDGGDMVSGQTPPAGSTMDVQDFPVGVINITVGGPSQPLSSPLGGGPAVGGQAGGVDQSPWGKIPPGALVGGIVLILLIFFLWLLRRGHRPATTPVAIESAATPIAPVVTGRANSGRRQRVDQVAVRRRSLAVTTTIHDGD